MRKKIINNILYVFIAQAAVLLLSIILNLIVPKVIGKIEFGYWQFFLLLTNYVGFFTFGFSDGYYLEQGGKTRDELNIDKLRGEFHVFVLVQFLFSILVFFSSFYLKDKRVLFQVVAVYLFFQNISNYFGFVFQAGGVFKKYSLSVVIDKIFFLVVLLLLVFFHSSTYLPFIVLYVCGKIVSVIYCISNEKRFLSFSKLSLKVSISNALITTLIGSSIMLSNILNSLIIGGGRFIIEHKWGIKEFGEVSLSFSFTLFFLLFVTQIGTVLFPLIKKLDSFNIDLFFTSIKSKLDVLLPIILILYYPLRIFLYLWLPQYNSSIRYLIILLPLCLYEGKFHMLYLVFFKALRYEKKLLLVNLSCFLISIILCSICAFLFNSLILVLFSLVFTIIVRSLYSEYLFNKKSKNVEDIIELLLIITFIFSNWYLRGIAPIIIFSGVFTGYYVFNYKKLISTFNYIRFKR